jgi:hypothetical protein
MAEYEHVNSFFPLVNFNFLFAHHRQAERASEVFCIAIIPQFSADVNKNYILGFNER